MRVEYYINLKCNLNCAGCAAFSPLVSENDFKSLEKIKEDFKKFNILVKDNISSLVILGGEPLLHPNINDIIIYFSELFPDTKLEIITNGIMIPKMDDEFFELVKSKVLLYVTEYLRALDYSKIYNILKERGIDYMIWGPKYKFGHQYLRENKEDIKRCWYRDNIFLLNDNKIYTCTEIAFFEIFNKKFKGEHNLEISEEDYIDLDEIDSYEELMKKREKIPSFCNYCDGQDKEFIDWKPSKRDINEWLKKKDVK